MLTVRFVVLFGVLGSACAFSPAALEGLRHGPASVKHIGSRPAAHAGTSQLRMAAAPRQKNNKIHVAASKGDHTAVKQLLADGAEVLEAGLGYKSALHFAATGGHTEIAKTLVEAGGDDLLFAVDKEQLNTAMHCAARDTAPMEMLEYFFELGGQDLLLARNIYESTPLHLAAYAGNIKAVKWMLENGPEDYQNFVNSFGKTAADIAESNGQDAVVKVLKNA
uniref:Uncharacterized protein n=1 Tax=Hemiselmis andersenii TaxID=464988 RepID=A0A7S1GV55_HEMAN|mmetsp:Transcript_16233/g.39170  ORF Transcript_16233/g.39170 Transcript_16233/m.39170 type:complete len:222 (+) Transcript_16233:72-737(+)|eukprot:CAMPEP_0114127754 /NCGR_PEP_ID=MMETSP0043_2-20121206/10558_1 /TAXON_ID=464988 /ORGANISM="Hemiselmis andersenii, Strain CCMP644" /LENGTH=221 /DNA_ID=CAMNT_0001220879 /DNA_START=49 /DNA_END=714 /DNA_ORIENTATION=+